MIERRRHEEVIEILVDQIHSIWSGALIGNSPFFIHKRFEFMSSVPEIGDLVVIDHVGRSTPAGDQIGWLVKVEDRAVEGEFEPDEKIPMFRYWTIDRLDGAGEIEWTNVSLLRVFTGESMLADTPLLPVRKS